MPISGVTLRANAINLVEFNDTAVLTCSVLNGSSLSYAWLKGDSEVTEGGGVQFSNGNATLTMVGVTRYDEGPFRCNVSNGLGHEISLPVRLNISCELTILAYCMYFKNSNNSISTRKTIFLLLLHQMVHITHQWRSCRWSPRTKQGLTSRCHAQQSPALKRCSGGCLIGCTWISLVRCFN